MRRLQIRKAVATACVMAAAFGVIAEPGISRHAKPHVVHRAPAGVSWKGAR